MPAPPPGAAPGLALLLGGFTAPVSDAGGVAAGGAASGAVVAPVAGAVDSGIVAEVLAVDPVLAAAAISIERRSPREARK